MGIIKKFKVVSLESPTDVTITPEFPVTRDSFDIESKWDDEIGGWMPLNLYPLESVGGGRFKRNLIVIGYKFDGTNVQRAIYFA